ncbi:flagellar biosynthesis protein FlhB [Cohnella thailandensis]|uniref:Flagellar biosynthetic protein FlhB n=1 Tax=Cohnella thailandensis TaxID=557557 RepID=A0A841T4D0_9BACL|nr:flagellar biosynthesis protein FlhB [Cohnella thailandensis]MBB6636717.1 flagellar biosynthesis protein FlhB [Cohnella thailandensis]
MNLQVFAGEKTEKATPKKRNEARQKGQVAQSQEIGTSLELIVTVSLFMVLGTFFWDRIVAMFADIFLHRLSMEITSGNVMDMFSRYAIQMLIFLSPIFIGAFVIIFAAHYFQVGWLFTTETLKFKFNSLNPINGFKRLFSSRSLVELVKSILKLLVIAIIVYLVLWSERERVMALAHVPIEDIFAFTGNLTTRLAMFVAVILFILALGDYYYQKYSYEKSLRMSKQDIKDEYKNQEGDPKIKAKIKERQRRMAIMRMMQDVPTADVIITNPTHFAVALKYDSAKMDAPKVIAKGQDYMALRIREIAKKNDVMIMENKPLARALYERAEIGQAIPPDLFQAVAEVLAYIYRLKGRRKA